eukprot:Blabericola_migrator_1__3101@NODE_18_length_22925_cov_118_464826_g15_i0_p14_GENE_NODE_18_length_22925_cov_118_464826_g15_i0NODE_18_length_22925_cov_118_464826_g15_i0_p14_ORF_typecomplete_len223_score30_52_NODE_18_length_22925_cov_118_464826_g15_i079348602
MSEAAVKETLANGGKVSNTSAKDLQSQFFVEGAREFFLEITKLRVFTYYFWTALTELTAASFLLIVFIKYGPKVNNKVVCPAKIPSYVVASTWIFKASVGFLTAWGHAYIETLTDEDFRQLNKYQIGTGFLVRTMPSILRLLFIMTYCVLAVIVLQVLLLPECNSTAILAAVSYACLVYLFVIFFGTFCKGKILIPAYLYDPMKPGNGVWIQIHRMMTTLGP